MPITVTTELPDAPQPSLGNGVEDEIQVDIQDETNYGDYRVQTRETGASSWGSAAEGWDEQVLPSDGDTSGTVSTQVTGREDGEEYEVRVRSETEHTEGAWTTPASITTTFPGATGLSLSNVTTTSVDLDWTDNADNETGQYVERRRQLPEGSWSAWQSVADAGPNTESYTDTTPQPATSYEYRIRPYTEHTSATSNVEAATTDGIGLTRTRTGGQGWHVEIDHPDGHTLTPRVLDGVQRNPRVNGLPRLRVPVPQDDTWSRDVYKRQEMRVYFDGQRQPIEELVDVEQQPDRTVLVGRGGTELLGRATTDYVQKQAHVAAETLITGETSYTANVDTPATTADEDVLLQDPDSQSELQTVRGTIPGDVPEVITSSGEHRPAQTCFFREAEDADSSTMTVNADYSEWSGDEVLVESSFGAFAEWEFTPEHDIPASALGVRWRVAYPDSSQDPETYANPEYEVRLDGEVLETRPVDTASGGTLDPRWEGPAIDEPSAGLSAGVTYTLRIEITAASGDAEVMLDCVGVSDERYHTSSDFTESISNNALAGPPLYPASTTIEYQDASPTESVVGGRGEVSVTNTQGSQAVSISNDNGQTWVTASNATTVEHDWTSPEDTIRLRVTLSRYTADASTTPSVGDAVQSLDSYALYADLQDIPILVSKGYDNRLVDVLRDIAEYGNFVWAIVPDGSGGLQVDWTQPGQRPASVQASLLDYSFEESESDVVEKAVVFGSSKPATDTLTADTSDTWQGLEESPIVEGSERVYNPGTGTTYDRTSDYDIKYQAGELNVLSTGTIADSESLEVEYRWKVSNSHTASGVTDPQVRRFEFEEIPTERGCGQAALYLVQELKDPVQSADVTIPKAPIGWDIVEAIQPPEFPGEPLLQLRELEQTPAEAVVRLANREGVGEIVEDLRGRLRGLAQRS